MKEIKVTNPKEVVEEAFWLAWQACGGPLGMGFLQNNPTATKEDVIQNVLNSGDYAGLRKCNDGELCGDYVFGRMMKLQIKYNDKAVFVRESKPTQDYQAWCGTYHTYEALIEAAINSIQKSYK